MDPSTTLLVGVGMLIPILVLVVLLILSGREGRGPLAAGRPRSRGRATAESPSHRDAWMPVVEALALPMETKRSPTANTLRLRGNLGAPVCELDIKIRIPEGTPHRIWSDLAAGGVRVRGDVSDEGGSAEGPRVVIRAERRMPMPDGLLVSREAAQTNSQGYLGVRDLGTGDAALDELVRVRGDDRVQVRALLADPEVQAALGALARANSDFEWSAGLIIQHTAPIELQPYEVTRVVDDARALARLLDAAVRRFAQPWQALAGALELRLDLSLDPPTLVGVVGGVRVHIDAAFDHGVVVLDPGSHPDEPSGGGLPNVVNRRWPRGRADDPLEVFLTAHEDASFGDGVLRFPVVVDPSPERQIRDAVASLRAR
jgi:hypothetical protein